MKSRSDQTQAKSHGTEVDYPRGSGETILVVDDYACLRDFVSDTLRRSGYCVLTANDGEAALALARATPRIDLLLTDIEMPRMRGDELARFLPDVHPAARIIFVSSSQHPSRAQEALHFVAKPFRTEELLAKVRAVLDSDVPRLGEASLTQLGDLSP